MTYLLPLLLLPVVACVAVFGSYLLRRLLPRDHTLQSRLTDEAISNRTQFAMKNVKGIMAVLLVIYFVTVGFIYS